MTPIFLYQQFFRSVTRTFNGPAASYTGEVEIREVFSHRGGKRTSPSNMKRVTPCPEQDQRGVPASSNPSARPWGVPTPCLGDGLPGTMYQVLLNDHFPFVPGKPYVNEKDLWS